MEKKEEQNKAQRCVLGLLRFGGGGGGGSGGGGSSGCGGSSGGVGGGPGISWNDPLLIESLIFTFTEKA